MNYLPAIMLIPPHLRAALIRAHIYNTYGARAAALGHTDEQIRAQWDAHAWASPLIRAELALHALNQQARRVPRGMPRSWNIPHPAHGTAWCPTCVHRAGGPRYGTAALLIHNTAGDRS